MSVFTVGPNSVYPSISLAMAAAGDNDTIELESGYSNELAAVTHLGMIVRGDASSLGIILQLANGISSLFLDGAAPINVLDSSAANSIVGNNGDNIITVTNGADAVSGGLGTDRLVVDYSLATNAVTGDSTTNVTEAGGSRLVTITAGTFEHFTINTGAGADTITTYAGDDVINTGEGASTVSAGQGANRITGGSGADTVTALDGGNIVDAGNGANTVTTGGGRDDITVGTGADIVVAGAGDDVVEVRGGADTASLGAGTDRLIVDYSALTTNVTGGPAVGSLLGGYDGIFGDGAVNTIIFQTAENFTVLTGSGNDVVATGDGSDVLSGGAGNDRLSGGGGADSLDGGAGVDAMTGGLGDDIFYVDNVRDTVREAFGEGANDTVFSSVTFSFAGTYAENLTLTGAARADGFGNTSINTIIGNSGTNFLDGLAGRDTLTGGFGNDRFQFTTALDPTRNVDHITDFSFAAGNNDQLVLENSVFTGLAAGGLAVGAFMANTTGLATQADDRIVYNTASGDLFYDADGLNGAAGVRFAILDNHGTVTASDFLII